ncbi:MAG: N-acetylmuramoyl-L-alanine amidase [Armatimonadetes bacterium]|nr:N-acetylmuramoyl-L-alanine amidase [Armatimonadota bacterium]
MRLRCSWIALVGVLVLMVISGDSPAAASRALHTAAKRTDLRTGPSKEHNRVTVLPAGIALWAVGYEHGWYKVELSRLLHAWVHESQVTPLDRSIPRPSPADITDISCRGAEEGTAASIYMGSARPWRVRQELDPPALKLDIFGARLRRYGVRQLPGDRCTWAVVPRQVADDWVEITFRLLFHQQRGWRMSFDGKRLVLLIRSGYQGAGVAGKLIVIDPGHGGPDTGAVGPTGLKEKDANLAIALRLGELLVNSGAHVRLLRTTDTSVGPPDAGKRGELEARLAASEVPGVDLFLSIHNNAVGGGDPARAAGTETYYWTPMSILPARILQNHLCAALHTQNRFISWRPFYVLRQTDVPRVLVECAYVSNPAEERRLRDPAFLDTAAAALYSGLEEFFSVAAGRPASIQSAVPDDPQ